MIESENSFFTKSGSSPTFVPSTPLPGSPLPLIHPIPSELPSQLCKSHLFEPFPLLCLVVCLKTGRLRTHLHRKTLSLVVCDVNSLRYIIPATAVAGFWIPRRVSDRKKFKREQRERKRIHRALWRLLPEARPADTENVPVESVFACDLDIQKKKNLCLELGFPWWAFPRSSVTYRYQRPSRAKVRLPEPTPPALETPNKDGWTADQVVRAIEKHGWSNALSNAVFALVYEQRLDEIPGGMRLRVADIATQHGLSAKTLSQYIWLVRKELRKSAPSLDVKSSVSAPSVEKIGISAAIETSLTEGGTNAN